MNDIEYLLRIWTCFYFFKLFLIDFNIFKQLRNFSKSCCKFTKKKKCFPSKLTKSHHIKIILSSPITILVRTTTTNNHTDAISCTICCEEVNWFLSHDNYLNFELIFCNFTTQFLLFSHLISIFLRLQVFFFFFSFLSLSFATLVLD